MKVLISIASWVGIELGKALHHLKAKVPLNHVILSMFNEKFV